MSFALWWVLASAPGGIWPSFGASWQHQNRSLWLQSAPTPFGGRGQFAASQGPWTLRYGSHSPGWGWSATLRGRGIWSDGRGNWAGLWTQSGKLWSKPFQVNVAGQPTGWVGSLRFGEVRIQRALPQNYLLTWNHKGLQLDGFWSRSSYALGIRHEALEWRRTTSGQSQQQMLRYRVGATAVEWRLTTGSFGSQQQFALRTQIGAHRFWLHATELRGSTQFAVRANVQAPNLGSWTAGWSPGQSMLRWSLPPSSSLHGSFVELGRPMRARVEYRGMAIQAEWNDQFRVRHVAVSARHQWNSRPRQRLEVPAEATPAWLDISYGFVGSPPVVELQAKGADGSTHRLQLLAQSRQWKDHIPPGIYILQGSAPPGWELELPRDSLRLTAGKIAPIHVALKRPERWVRWVSGTGESGG